MNAAARPVGNFLGQRLIVLRYQGLRHSSSTRGDFDPRYSISPAAFDDQMRRLRQYCTATWLPESGLPLQPPAEDPWQPAVMLTFDGADHSLTDIVTPRLQELKLAALFFISADQVERPGMLSGYQVRQLCQAGMMVGAHGRGQRPLHGLAEPILQRELATARDRLEQLTGAPVDFLSLFYNRASRRIMRAAWEVGFCSIFGARAGDNHRTRQHDLVQRIFIPRYLAPARFEQILRWEGSAPQMLTWRERLRRWPHRLAGLADFESPPDSRPGDSTPGDRENDR